MPNSNRVAKLQYEINPKGFDALDKGFAQLNRNHEAARERVRALGEMYKQAQLAANDLTKPNLIAQQQRDWDRTLKSVERYVDELDEADKATKRLAGSTKAVKPVTADDRFGEVSRNVGLFGDAETALRTVGVGGPVPEIFAVAEALPRLKVALEGLPEQAQLAAQAIGVGGLGLGVALAGLAGAVLLLAKASQDAREVVQRRSEAEQAFNALILRETQGTIDKKIEAARFDTELAILNQQTAKNARDAAYDAYLASSNIFDTNALFEAYAETDKIFQASIKTTEDAQQAEENLLTARQNSLVVTRTLEEQQVANAQAFLTQAQKTLAFLSNTEIDAQVNARTATSQSIKETIATLTLEREARQKAIDQQLVQGDTLEEYSQRIAEISAIIASTGNTLPAVILRELEEAYKEHGEKLAQIEADNAEKRAAALATKNDAIAEAERSAGLSRAENERKAGEARSELQRKGDLDREKEQERHEKELAKIQRTYNFDRTQAIQDRDVVALDAAKRARKEALANENDANKERKDSIADALTEQNRQIDKSLAEQNRTVEDRLSEQLRTIEKRYNEQLTTAQTAADKAVLIENAKNEAILLATQTGADQLLAKHLAFWEAANAIPVQSSEGGTQSARSLLSGTTTPFPVSPYAVPPVNGTPYLDSQRGTGSSITIPINVNGMSRQSVITTSGDIARRTLDEILKEAGY